MDVQQELAELRTVLASVAAQVDAVEAEVDAGLSGPTPGATENRTIRTARARLAQQHAREMREGLDLVRARAAAMAGEARSTQARVAHDEPRRRPPADDRDVVGQAQGILIARHGLDVREAHDRLLRAAGHANARLVDVAAWVVDNTLGAGRRPRPEGPA